MTEYPQRPIVCETDFSSPAAKDADVAARMRGILLATSGLGAFAQWQPGIVSEQIAESACTRPVLVVLQQTS